MITDFDSLTGNAKVWIFKGERSLNAEEIRSLKEGFDRFIEQWTSHGANVKGAYTFYSDQFLIVGAETPEGPPSGCSTDTLIKFVNQASTHLGINLMDNASFFFRKNGKFDKVGFLDLQKTIEAGDITEDTEILNNQVAKKADLEQELVIPAAIALGSRYFSTVKQ